MKYSDRQKLQLKKLSKAEKDNKALRKESKGLKQARHNPFSFVRKILGVQPNGSTKAPKTAEESLPFLKLYEDGLMQVDKNTYSRSIEFLDIDYLLTKPSEQDRIFVRYAEFLNSFDHTVQLQLSLINQSGYLEDFKNSIQILRKGDAFDSYREEYESIIHRRLTEGSSDIQKRKILTFLMQAETVAIARAKLNQVELTASKHLADELGVKVFPMDGKARFELLYNTLQSKRLSEADVTWDWNELFKDQKLLKSALCPYRFVFERKQAHSTGDVKVANCLLKLTATDAQDTMLSEIQALPIDLIISVFLKAQENQEAIKRKKRKLTAINQMLLEEQQKAIRAGYDPDLIPPDLKLFSDDAHEQLDTLQSKNERAFDYQVVLSIRAKKYKDLDPQVEQIRAILQKFSCGLSRLDYQQEPAFFSSLPIGKKQVLSNRVIDTSSAAIQVPFTVNDLMQTGDALFYGQNQGSKNIIMADRKQHINPNGLVLGRPGAGKSFQSKMEMIGAYCNTDDDIIICDPQSEYWPLINALNGQEIRLSTNSKVHINPMDINTNYGAGDNEVSVKTEFMLSVFELILGRNNSLEPSEKSTIDRNIRKSYRDYIIDPKPENVPILEDVYNNLIQEGEEGNQIAKYLADSLELYVHGALNYFNHRTNVDIDNRVVCYDIQALGNQLKTLAMMVVQDQVYNRVTRNKKLHRATRYYCDEFHLLLRDPLTAAFSVRVFKEFRKFGGIPTGITQNVTDFLASREIENILSNSPFIIMLDQGDRDREILQEKLDISPYLIKYITNAPPGSGLLFYGDVTVPFRNQIDTQGQIYKILTTKPDEVMVRKEDLDNINGKEE